MGWEQRNADFCKAQTNAQMAYIEAEREVDKLQSENAKLRELVRDMHRAICGLVVLGDGYVERHEDELCALDDRMSELGVEV